MTCMFATPRDTCAFCVMFIEMLHLKKENEEANVR